MTNTIPITSQEIHVWTCATNEITDLTLLAAYERLLDADEILRMRKFYFEKDRHSYLVSHALIRTVLSRYSPIDAGDWRFEHNAYGKPEIASSQNPLRLRFNLSHTDGRAVCAVTQDDCIGVDIEKIQPTRPISDIASRYFAESEVIQLNELPPPEREQRFFDYWTLKEAYIKARGQGLSIPLDSFSFRFEVGIISFENYDNDSSIAGPWHFWLADEGDDYVVACCKEKSMATESPTIIQYKVTPLEGFERSPAKTRCCTGAK